jgi:hypothetical protein
MRVRAGCAPSKGVEPGSAAGQGLLAARGGAGVLPTFAAAGMAGAVGSVALYPVRALHAGHQPEALPCWHARRVPCCGACSCRGCAHIGAVHTAPMCPGKRTYATARPLLTELRSRPQRTDTMGKPCVPSPALHSAVPYVHRAIAGAQMEVVRCQIATDVTGAFRGPAHAASALVRAGGVRSLYRGLLPSLAAIAPEAAITYGAAPTRSMRASGTPQGPEHERQPCTADARALRPH